MSNYLKNRPLNQFTMLDCHDGIPVKPDLDELVSTHDAKKIVDICLKRGANLSLIFSDKHKAIEGFDIHQIRGTYYSLLECNDDAYIAARAIQFFAPGIPQVYYVGLLAGENDIENVTKTGEGREINRHILQLMKSKKSLQKPVVQRLIKLIQFRNQFPAFNGIFKVLDTPSDNILLTWEYEKYNCSLNINLNTYKTQIIYNDEFSKIYDKVI